MSVQDFVKNDAKEIIKYFPMLQKKDPEHYITEIKSNGLNLYKFEIPSEYIIKYYIKKDNRIFMLRPENVYFDLYPGLKTTVDQMVYSFKFID